VPELLNEPPTMNDGIENASGDSATPLRARKYAVLLAILLGSLAVQSIGVERGAGGVLADLVATLLGVAIFVAVFGHPRDRMGMAAVLAGVLVTGWARYALGPGPEHSLAIAYHVLMALFLWIAVAAILRELFRTPAIGGENVRGAICGYLIAGGAWGSTNALTYLLVPAAFSFDPKVAALLADWHGRVALFSYYSFAQRRTIGYADDTPVRAPATTLSLMAAMFGVFYTAVVVSQLVGMAQAGRREGPERR
jgi:hypothetical protein